MLDRIPVSKSSMGWIATGLCLVSWVAAAGPRQIRPDAAAGDSGRLRSLQSSVTALRSQIESLERSNHELRRRLDELDRRGPGGQPPTAEQFAEIQEGLEFGEKVMRIVEPRLAELRHRVSFLEERYDGHAHQYIRSASMGWTTWRNVQDFGEKCPDCLLPFRSPERTGGEGSGYLETSGPTE